MAWLGIFIVGCGCCLFRGVGGEGQFESLSSMRNSRSWFVQRDTISNMMEDLRSFEEFYPTYLEARFEGVRLTKALDPKLIT